MGGVNAGDHPFFAEYIIGYGLPVETVGNDKTAFCSLDLHFTAKFCQFGVKLPHKFLILRSYGDDKILKSQFFIHDQNPFYIPFYALSPSQSRRIFMPNQCRSTLTLYFSS